MRFHIIMFCLSIQLFTAKSQSNSTLSDALNTSIPQIIKSSPHSQLFEKYVNQPVTEYNGTANVSIPLCEVEIRGLKIPVILSYNTSGIKYKQYDGDVGVGWSINVGGYRITREVRGNTDEKCPFFNKTEYLNELMNPDVEKRDSYLASMLYYNSPESSNIVYGRFNFQDGERDIFTFYTPTAKGKFIISDLATQEVTFLGQGREKFSFVNTANSPYPIDGQQGIKSFCMIDEGGFNYHFGEEPSGILQVEYTTGDRIDYTAWPLKQIISPMKDTINFRYKEIIIDQSKNREQYILVSDACDPGCQITNDPQYGSPINWTTLGGVSFREKQKINSYNSVLSLNEIESENIIINFIRSTDNTNLINEIQIKDKFTGDTLKKIILDYQKVNSERDIYDNQGGITREIYLLHSLLSSITFSSKNDQGKHKYQFEYYPGPSGYISSDQWGYYSGMTYSQSAIYSDLFLSKDFKTDLMYYRRSNSLNNEMKILSDVCQYGWVDRSKNTGSGFYSLKKIRYPTGGISEYIYEPNQFLNSQNQSIQGGGQRIKKISFRPNNISYSMYTEYKYGENEDGNGFPNLHISSSNFASETLNYDVYFNCPNFINNTVSANTYFNRRYSTNPITLSAEISNFAVNYKNVNIYKYDEGNTKMGKTVMTFKIPDNYVVGQTNQDVYSSGFEAFNVYGYGGSLIEEYRYGYMPQKDSVIIYNETGEKIYKEKYEYMSKFEGEPYYNNLKVIQRIYLNHYNPIGFSNFVYKRSNFLNLNSLFETMNYRLYTGFEQLTKKTTTHFVNDIEKQVVTESYLYNDLNQLNIINQDNSSGGLFSKSYLFPIDYADQTENSDNIYNKMVIKNILSPVISQITVQNGHEIDRIKTEYRQSNDIIVPSFTQTSLTGESNMKTVLTNDSYNNRGNLLQRTTIDGLTTTYLWSYKGQYPIAEIKNASYQQIEMEVGSSYISNLTENPYPASSDLSKVDALRFSTTLPDIEVTTFTYKPLVGMLTATDPRGVTTYYEYDTFNRLKQTYIIENGEKKILQKYDYHYANQQ